MERIIVELSEIVYFGVYLNILIYFVNDNIMLIMYIVRVCKFGVVWVFFLVVCLYNVKIFEIVSFNFID